MAWEVFSREYPARSTTPTLTISAKGRCSLNRAASEAMHKQAVETILLMWDRDAYKLALRPIAKKDSRSFAVRYNKRGKDVVGAVFSGVMFLKHIEYDMTETKTYPVNFDSDEGLFIVELPKDRFHDVQQPLIAVEGGKKQERHAKAAR
jgi:hypothetical protein